MANYYENLEYSVNKASASSNPRNLELIISIRIASPVYTGKRIKGEADDGDGNGSITVFMVDSQTQQKVITGPAASARVQLVLLPEDFGGATTGDGSVWTPLEFKNSIVPVWKGKKNLLQGDLGLVLKHGSGTVGQINFKHDRYYFSNARFRLGAMVVDCLEEVKEAITNPFEVKDRRNELISKNRRLSLKDKVWQLKNIGKKGPVRKRLEEADIWNVKDFLESLSSNPRDLQKVYGCNGKKWEVTVHHAKTCVDDNKVCFISYDNKGNVQGSVGSTSQRSTNESFFDYDGGIELDSDDYRPYAYDYDLFGKPPLYESDLFSNKMTISTEDFEECDMFFHHDIHRHEPFHAHQEDGSHGAWTTVGGGGGVEDDIARERWMKLHRLWFTVASFMKKVGSGGGATLVV